MLSDSYNISLSSVFAAMLQDIAIFQGSFCSAFNSFVRRLEFIWGILPSLVSEKLSSSIEQPNDNKVFWDQKDP